MTFIQASLVLRVGYSEQLLFLSSFTTTSLGEVVLQCQWLQTESFCPPECCLGGGWLSDGWREKESRKSQVKENITPRCTIQVIADMCFNYSRFLLGPEIIVMVCWTKLLKQSINQSNNCTRIRWFTIYLFSQAVVVALIKMISAGVKSQLSIYSICI